MGTSWGWMGALMATQAPTASAPEDEVRTSSRGWRVGAVLLWMLTAMVGAGGGLLVFLLSLNLDGFFLWYLAVPFGLLLGGAMVATRQVMGRRGSIPVVLAASLVVGVALHGMAWFLGQQRAEQSAVEACSVEELAQLEAQSFYIDLDQLPTGTAFNSCYVLYTVDSTGQQAWVELEQLLLGNGWQHPFEPEWAVHDAEMYRPFQWLYHDGFVLIVNPEGSHDLPGDDLTESDDGATTFALDITTSPCSQQDVDMLQPIYDSLYAAAGYVGEPGPGIELWGSGPDEPCQTGLGFATSSEAEGALLQAMGDEGWTLTGQEQGRFTFQRGSDAVEAVITERVSEDLEEQPIGVTITSAK